MKTEKILNKLTPYLGLIICCLGILFYFPFLGAVHLFDWDEINFAESSREMLVTGNYWRVTVDYQPFWEKPPLFFWLQAISMKIFGINEFAARFPNALFGVLTLVTLYFTGKRIKNAGFGFLWAFIFFISFLPFFYFKSGIIDPVFNYFIFVSVLFLIRAIKSSMNNQRVWFVFIAGLLNGMAVLTKGPVGLLLIIITFLIVWISGRFRKVISFQLILLFLLGVFITSSFWYLPELINHGPWFFKEFIRYQVELFSQPVAGHSQGFYYHFLVVFIGCFPLSIFALPALFSKKFSTDHPDHSKWLKILFWVVMILFTIVSTKIVHYSSMAYLPLSFMAALYLEYLITGQQSPRKWMLVILASIGLVFSAIMFMIPFFFLQRDFFILGIRDPFTEAIVEQNFSWSWFECLFGGLFLVTVFVLIILLKRKNVFGGIVIFGLMSVFILNGYLKMVVPKIEKHVQGELIEFYQSIKGEDVYVVSVGFKTYAYLFYFEQPYHENKYTPAERREWLTRGVIDKPTYIVVKNTEKYVKELPDVKLVKEAGGFMIYRRDPL